MTFKCAALISILFIFLAIPVIGFSDTNENQDYIDTTSNHSNWSDWNYQLEITVDNSGGSALTDYQVLVQLDGDNIVKGAVEPN